MKQRFNFWWRYFRKQTPWDTRVVPPEIVRLAETKTPGRALDLGCGTGTSSLYLADRGWQVVGIDFIPTAIAQAKALAAQRKLTIAFHVADAARLEFLDPPFDWVIDVGCLHSLPAEARRRYADHVLRLTPPGSAYTLYGFQPRGARGIDEAGVRTLFAPSFTIAAVEYGRDTGRGTGSAWYYLDRQG
jgi:SAM-dependent methyltransferase